MISIILPALNGHAPIHRFVEMLGRQPGRQHVELLVICRDPQNWARLPGIDGLVDCGSDPIHQARWRALLVARGESVLFAEDHCIPEPGWIEVALSRSSEGRPCVGFAMLPGNTDSLAARATFLLGYGQWLRASGGYCSAVAGNHSLYLRSELLRLSPCQLLIPSLAQAALLRGRQCFLEDAACLRHWDDPSLRQAMLTVFCIGCGFGRQRSHGWGVWQKLTYAMALPVIALLHWRRSLREGLRLGQDFTVLLLCAGLALVWATGEVLGLALPWNWCAALVERAERDHWKWVD